MGTHDSSLTRVAPVFDALMDRDPSGRTWLLPLLHLGSRSADRLDAITPTTLLPDHPRWWGKNERRLEPPKTLLRWLVANACAPASDALWGAPATRAKRQRLVARDPNAISEALRLLDTHATSREWYVLEGRSQPDACLESDSLLVVIEGKRTERKATAVTTWMRSRSQMLRHMDAGWEISGGKRVLGLMIVEGPGGADATTATDHWLKQANEQVVEQTLTAGLPHRSAAERDQIAENFLGLTTWQRVCAEFELNWPPYQESG